MKRRPNKDEPSRRRKSKGASRRTGTRKGRGPEDERYVVREVELRDLDSLYALSSHLNSVNFPHDREVLGEIVKKARQSFLEKIADPFRREYMFVIAGARSGRIAGTSSIIAQHGHPDAPHVFFDVVEDQRYSVTLDRHFNHVTLRLGFDYRGPTEIGALVIAPELRSRGLGKPLSYARFLFIAMYRDRFRPGIIAELMPPLLPDGRSLLWEHVGKHFTGLTYQAADKLSHRNKEFIISLFPQTPIHASLLPPDVQSVIGQVGEASLGVRRMLEAVAFDYSHRIDPFDGGPHFEAFTDRVTVIRETRLARVAKSSVTPEDELQVLKTPRSEETRRALVGVGESSGPTHFRATVGAVRFEGNDAVLSPEVRALLKTRPGATVHVMPF